MSLALGSNNGRIPHIASDEAQEKLKDKIKAIGLKDKEREVEAQASLSGLPYINLQGFPINTDSISLIPEAVAERLKIICFWLAISDLRVGAVEPSINEVKSYIKTLGAEHFTEPAVYLISEESFRIAKEVYKRVPKLKKSPTCVSVTEEDLNRYGEGINTLKDLEDSLKNLTTTSAVTTMIAGGLKTRASDIHLEAEEGGVKLRYRIDGVLYAIATLPVNIAVKAISRLKLLAGLKINVSDRPQDGRFTINLTKDKVDVRVSALPTAHGESIVMRLLRWSAGGVDFEKLGLVGTAREHLVKEMTKPNGMIISTGPTGSGKTTTLYAVINKLNNAERKIITIEDPIEYKLAGVNQSQVDVGHDYTFANGLRSILRQDPNIVMVGEIRDPETAEISVQAALTGHLVLSTLHTNDAAGAIPRFLSLGAKAELLPSALNAIIGQRLVRRLCDVCKKSVTPSGATIKIVDKALASLPPEEAKRLPAAKQFFTSPGCDKCQGLGYKGQIGIFEILLMTKALKLAIAEEGISDTRIAEIAEKDGMVTMMQDGILKALTGITSLEEVFRVTKE